MNSFDPNKVLLTKVGRTRHLIVLPRYSTSHTDSQSQQGATLYTIQLALNLIWMPLFFRLKRPIEATVDIVALTGTVGYLTYVWGQVDEIAGWALVPYLSWLGFATYLSAGAGYLNNWSFADKEAPQSEKSEDTKYVDERL